jgi:hypothetical protein
MQRSAAAGISVRVDHQAINPSQAGQRHGERVRVVASADERENPGRGRGGLDWERGKKTFDGSAVFIRGHEGRLSNCPNAARSLFEIKKRV